ncbi:DNA topoisomerase I [Liberibacter crescens BT-1]|uniref:DNA topoisomerase 1 n=1 Tax=Liberibacter crescens (strain BT-1) TaxID=1215343 RepID=L0EVH2_LIBCB|nr:type I DNA topoisomerase [Liberibacter crescens]AGA64396.1 DNA topoisomerase I [Liberibacter crescens BT-1]
MYVVVVESPTKAKTISKYLGSDYKVLSSFGHVRDLPAKNGSVIPQKDFEMTWEVDKSSKKHMEMIANAVKSSESLILATDPDREGEAISWHVLSLLQNKNITDNKSIKRVVFNAVTKQAVLDAIKHPRDIDLALVSAYLARRALDYLVGFNLSPVLWRKLPGARSAGRVQSVALRLICNRELDIERFIPKEYWLLSVLLETQKGELFEAQLVSVNSKRIEKNSICNQHDANVLTSLLTGASYKVEKIEKKPIKRNPSPPFTTSTLQQSASSRLGFSASKSMKIAQKLYEGINLDGETVGLITYMRTDGVQIAAEAIEAARHSIKTHFGDQYVPEKPRVYSTKAKNAQEAHEAIRPTDFNRFPNKIAKFLESDQLRLYELIWKRSIASQMSSAEFERTTITIQAKNNHDDTAILRKSGSTLCFDGFLASWKDYTDTEKDDDEDTLLPYMKQNEVLLEKKINASQHFTEPPPRYSEASLIKNLEELGIGRPSTYTAILTTLCDRDYIVIDKRQLLPQNKGRLVTAFLESFFRQYVEYDFTAELEEKLDMISSGALNWKDVLREFWQEFIIKIDNTKKLCVSDVIDTLNNLLAPLLFPQKDDVIDSRKCLACNTGQLSLKLSKYGAFIGCTNYPKCNYTRLFSYENQLLTAPSTTIEPKILGSDPLTNETITLRSGRFGFYVQRGEEKNKMSRCSLPKSWNANDVDYEKAVALLSLPRSVGTHPETDKIISTGIGRYGPYLKYDDTYFKLQSIEEVFNISIDDATVIITEKLKQGKKKSRSSAKKQELGEHPKGGMITLRNGRYGPYINWGKINITLPTEEDVQSINLEHALQLLSQKKTKSK